MGRARNQAPAVSMDLFDPVLGFRRGREETEAEQRRLLLQQDWQKWTKALPVTREQRQLLQRQEAGSRLPMDGPSIIRLGDTLQNYSERFVEATHETKSDLVKIRTVDDQRAFQFWLTSEERGVFLRHCQQMLTDEPPEKHAQMMLRMNRATPNGSTDANGQGHIEFFASTDGVSPYITLTVESKTIVLKMEPYEIAALAGWMVQNAPVTDPEF